MGKIIRNGITYGGTSNSAGNISYNNTTSGLNSVTVQNAITELKSLFDNSEHVTMEIVQELPLVSEAEDNVIYLIDEDQNDIYEMYIVAEVEGTRQYVNIGDTEVNLSDYLKQVIELPTAGASEVGNIYQYKGATTADYTHGYVYECVSDGAVSPTYTWEEVPTFEASDTRHFIGTSLEWEALTAAEKAEYEDGDIVFTDDNSGTGIIENTIVDTINPISAHAVYEYVQTRPDTIGADLIVPVSTSGGNNYYAGRIKKDGEKCLRYRKILWFGEEGGDPTPDVFNYCPIGAYVMESYAGLPKELRTIINQSLNSYATSPMRHIVSFYAACLPTEEVPIPGAPVRIVNICPSEATFTVSGDDTVYIRPMIVFEIGHTYNNPSSAHGFAGPVLVDIVFNNFQA